MTQISDEVLHEMVQRIVRQTVNTRFTTLAASSPVKPQDQPQTSPEQQPDANQEKHTVAIGTDHGGVDLKETLKQDLIDGGYYVIDCGTHTKESVDYPDIARSVSELVASGKAWRGVIIDGAGIGSCMAANKVRGVRAALCYDYATASNSREHNNANVLTLGAGLIGNNLAKGILKIWLGTEFGGGRHARRVDKIMAIEKSFLEDGTKS